MSHEGIRDAISEMLSLSGRIVMNDDDWAEMQGQAKRRGEDLGGLPISQSSFLPRGVAYKVRAPGPYSVEDPRLRVDGHDPRLRGRPDGQAL